MKPTLTLLLSLLCLTAGASPGQPYFARQQVSSSPFTPPDLSGLAYWWVASDLSNSPVALLADRIKGKQLVSTNTERPTWSVNKMTFDQTKHLYIRPTTIPCDSTTGSNWAVMVVCTCKQLSSNGSFLSTSNNLAIIQLNSGTPNQIRWSATYRNVANGTTFDFIYSTIGGVRCVYTNAVLFETNSTAISANIDIGRVGSYVGGDIYEVAIWTNAIGWTTADLANLHKYATNTYSYTP